MLLVTRLLLAASLGLTTSAFAQNNVFLGPANTPTDWMQANAWSLGQVPDMGNNFVQIWDYRVAMLSSGSVDIQRFSLGDSSSRERGSVTQTGGSFVVRGDMTMSSPAPGDASVYAISGGSFEAEFLRMRFSARFEQSGGDVWIGALSAGGHDANFESRYLLTGGSFHVEREMFFASPSNSEYAVLDLDSSQSTVTTGAGSWVSFGTQSIANAHNGSLVVGAGSLVQVEPGMDLLNHFLDVELNGGVLHTVGTAIQVDADERVLIGANNYDFTDGLVVDGYAGERFYSGATFRSETFQVNAGGHVDMGRFGLFGLNGEEMGVFGGLAEMRRLQFTGQSGVVSQFDLDGGTLRVNGEVSFIGSHQTVMRVVDGLFEADRLTPTFKFDFIQEGGTSRIGAMSVATGSQTRFMGGVVEADFMGTANTLALIQHGGAHVRVGELDVRSGSTYRFIGSEVHGGVTPETADLVIEGRLDAVGPHPSHGGRSVIDLADQARTIYAEGAIIDFSIRNAQPFHNAQNATFVLDENSLLVVAPGVDLHTAFDTFVDDGIVLRTGDRLTIAADREVHGRGVIPHGTEVYGRLIADDQIEAQQLTVYDGGYVDLGDGVLLAPTDTTYETHVMGGTLRVQGLGIGLYQQSGGESFFETANGNTLRLSGGTANVADFLSIVTLDYDDGDGQLVLGPGALAEIDTVVNGTHGRLHVSENTLLQFADPAAVPANLFGEITGPGLLHVAGQDLTLPSGFRLRGDLIPIEGDILNHGEINPGFTRPHHGEVGVLTIFGDYEQAADGVLRIEMAYQDDALVTTDAESDRLVVTGDATLDGELNIVFLDSFVPLRDLEIQVLDSDSSVTGQFANTTADGRIQTAWGSFAIAYSSSVMLSDFVPGQWGDLDGDGFVGASDLDIVLANWGDAVRLGDALAGDWTGDGRVDDDDLQVVLDNWGQGDAPSIPGIPEPGSLALLTLSSLALLRCRRATR
ncbi:hypothetical protein OT109_04630 [Phycisphaeraceae bacterium D3-23]